MHLATMLKNIFMPTLHSKLVPNSLWFFDSAPFRHWRLRQAGATPPWRLAAT